MSNVTTRDIMHFVGEVFGTRKTMFRIGSDEAAIVAILAQKHTENSIRSIGLSMGFKPTGIYYEQFTESIWIMTARIENDFGLAEKIEAVEKRIDEHHEKQPPPEPKKQRGPKRKQAGAITKAPRQIKEQDMTEAWWRANDERFRRHLQSIAE